MKSYQSHKIVQAAKIVAVLCEDYGDDRPGGRVGLTLESGASRWSQTFDYQHSIFLRDIEELLDCDYQSLVDQYLVRYPDGYLSISPAKAFEDGYVELDDDGLGMSFSTALTLLKLGKRVARKGWNGKGMFLFLVPGSVFKVNRPPLLGIYPEGTEISYHGHIDMKTAQGDVVPWVASQTDLLAVDWELAP